MFAREGARDSPERRVHKRGLTDVTTATIEGLLRAIRRADGLGSDALEFAVIGMGKCGGRERPSLLRVQGTSVIFIPCRVALMTISLANSMPVVCKPRRRKAPAE